MNTYICEVCHKEFKAYQRRGKHITCSNKCFGVIAKQLFKGRKCPWVNKEEATKRLVHLTGENHPLWKGGKHKSGRYMMVMVKNHPHPSYAKRECQYILEHRHVMEQHLGRYLYPTEIVHHTNHDTFDNRIENLELVSDHSSHMSKCHCSKRDHKGRFLSNTISKPE